MDLSSDIYIVKNTSFRYIFCKSDLCGYESVYENIIAYKCPFSDIIHSITTKRFVRHFKVTQDSTSKLLWLNILSFGIFKNFSVAYIDLGTPFAVCFHNIALASRG